MRARPTTTGKANGTQQVDLEQPTNGIPLPCTSWMQPRFANVANSVDHVLLFHHTRCSMSHVDFVQPIFIPAGMTKDELDRFVLVRHGTLALTDSDQTKLFELSGGVPLYVNELVRMINERRPVAKAKQREDEHVESVPEVMDTWSRSMVDEILSSIREHYHSRHCAFHQSEIYR